MQNTPPGSAALSLHARVAGLAPGDIQQALWSDKSLLQAWNMRGAPYVFPAKDRLIFTCGLLPRDEESIRAFIPGVVPALERIGVRATEVVEWAATALVDALDGVERTKDELGRELAAQVSQVLTTHQRSTWEEPSWYASGQSLGESVIRFILPVLALQGLCCHTIRRENKAYIGRTDQWLGEVQPEVIDETARAELARRYLHAYGPSTVHHFSEWAGISPIQALESWQLLDGELVEVSLEKRKTWLLQSDFAGLLSLAAPSEIRFLPPHDPYLQLRDRETLIPEKTLQRRIWRASGSPGVLLADGHCLAIWRATKKGNRLVVKVEPFISISQGVRSQIAAEANTLLPYWNCHKMQVEFSEDVVSTG